MAAPRVCPYCNQVLPEFRMGVRLTALKARIFDLVLRGGRDGIESDDLMAIAYDDHCPKDHGNRGARKKKTLYAHISQINEEIAQAGYRIIGTRGGGPYRLEKKWRAK